MSKNDLRDVENEIQDVQGNPIFQLINSIVGRSPLGRAIMVIVAIVIVLGGLYFGGNLSGGGSTGGQSGAGSSSNSGNSGGSSANSGNSGNSDNSGNSGGGSGGGSSIKGLPAASFKQAAKQITYNGCPPEGDGGDPVLNNNKNRVDVGKFQPVAFDTIEQLPWPQATERRDHAQWSAADKAQVEKAEGLPVQVEAYLALARQEGPETPNCHSSTDLDFHIWMIRAPGGSNDRDQSVVIEATPRVRANHPGWTVSNLNKIATSGTKIRVSGWLMLDPEHPDQVGKTRGTIWEIHPIIDLEVQQGVQWVKLDNYRQ